MVVWCVEDKKEEIGVGVSLPEFFLYRENCPSDRINKYK